MTKRLDSGHVYVIINNNNNKRYIGQTWFELADLWYQHKSKNKRGCPYLFKAIVKHGSAAFTIESLVRFTDQNMADLLEIDYINLYCSNEHQYGYNLTGGGQNNRPPMPQATRDKISQSRKGMIFSAETRLKMSRAQKTKNLSEDGKKQIDAAHARKRKLTMEQANQIRQESRDGASSNELSKKYNVSALVIHLIIKNKTYIKDYK